MRCKADLADAINWWMALGQDVSVRINIVRELIDFYWTKRLNNFLKVSAPMVQRFLPLSQEIVPLVYGGHSRNRPLLMVEDLVCHVRRHSQTSHARHYGSPEVMDAPPANPAYLVDGPVAPRPERDFSNSASRSRPSTKYGGLAGGASMT